MSNKSRKNPPGVPPWPDVDDSQPGVVIVSAKIKDPDVLEARAKRVGLVVTIILAPVVVAGLPNSREYVPDLFDSFSLKSLGILAGIGIAGLFGFLLCWAYATFFIGYAVNAFILFWLRSKVFVEFTGDSIEVVFPRRQSMKLDRGKNAIKVEFNAAPHPAHAAAARASQKDPSSQPLCTTRFLDAFTVNLVHGLDEVRLLSTHTQKEAGDFVSCLIWAAAHTGSATSSMGSASSLATSSVDDE